MNYLYVANWKMNLSVSASINFCSNNYSELIQLAHNADIVICPSFITLAPIAQLLKNSPIALGAQNCSVYESGSYTGEVSANMLAEIDTTYCMVGHSERRMLFEETTEKIIKKTELLYAHGIQPIICIGETKEHSETHQTLTALTQQLAPVLAALTHNAHIVVAYEPVWAIGTGIIPEYAYLRDIFTWLAGIIRMQLPECTVQLLYGGSVNTTNIAQLKKINAIHGFLIGGASTHFEQFAEIIKTSL